tara:strand:- start:329 stop:742 length:414 start_codon:yes stop_codon:yes gene_type:complete
MDNPQMKPEYEVGDFVRVERYVSLKAHTEDCYEYTGIVVKKNLKDKAIRTIYWFNDEYDYLVSVPDYGGDYVNVNNEQITGIINLPIEYKLNMVTQFGNWWTMEYKFLLFKLLDQAIHKDKSKSVPGEIVNLILEFY